MTPDTILQLCGKWGGSLFTEQLQTRLRVWIGLLVLTALSAGLVILASAIDRTLELPGAARGLLEHYGYQACFWSGPLILGTLYITLSYFLRTLSRITSAQGLNAESVRGVIKLQLQSLFLRSRTRSILGLLVFVGVATSLVVFRQLQDPVSYWGVDVFNARSYRVGYVLANAYLMLAWGVIYPLALFWAIHLTVSAELIVRELKKLGILHLDVLHPDKCGGMGRFGTQNLLVMILYLWPFGALFVLHLTYSSNYVSLIAGSALISTVFVIQSVYGILWIARAIRSEKDRLVFALNGLIESALRSTPPDSTLALANLQYRQQVVEVATIPYTPTVSVLVNVLRFAPSLFAVAKIAQRLFGSQ